MNKNHAYDLLACMFLAVSSATIVFFLYEGNVPGGSDWSTHLSKIRFIVDNLPAFPRWCPESGFGTPFLWDYPPFSYYAVAFIVWIFNLSIFEGCKVFFILILSVGAISTYALADELGLKRIGCFASGLLLLGSYNIYAWWWIGQLPNMTAVMFTPLALLGFLRAVRKNTLFNILLAGLSYTPIFLSHLLNTLIFGFILLFTGIFMIILKPELFYVSRGHKMPLKYTMRLPKVLFLSLLEAFTLSSWWYLPFIPHIFDFLAQQAGYGTISAGESAKAIALKIEFLLSPDVSVGGVKASALYYMGIGHLILILGATAWILWKRRDAPNFYWLPFFGLRFMYSEQSRHTWEYQWGFRSGLVPIWL